MIRSFTPRAMVLLAALVGGPGLGIRIAAATPPVITAQPVSDHLCIFPGGIGDFALTATGTDLTYQWQQQDLLNLPDFINISDGFVFDPFGNPIFVAEGTSTNHLTLSQGQGYGQVFRCIVSGPDGMQVESTEVTMTYCHPDYNCSGEPTVSDIFAFLSDWFAQSGQLGPGFSADYDFDEEVAVPDIFAFVTEWFQGCD